MGVRNEKELTWYVIHTINIPHYCIFIFFQQQQWCIFLSTTLSARGDSNVSTPTTPRPSSSTFLTFSQMAEVSLKGHHRGSPTAHFRVPPVLYYSPPRSPMSPSVTTPWHTYIPRTFYSPCYIFHPISSGNDRALILNRRPRLLRIITCSRLGSRWE